MDRVSQYGVIDPEVVSERLYQLKGVIEKPKDDKAPSNLAIVGRYILQPEIFNFISEATVGAGGEIQLTDAIADLIPLQNVYAYEFQGQRYDCGSKIGHIKANIEYALRHPELSKKTLNLLTDILNSKTEDAINISYG